MIVHPHLGPAPTVVRAGSHLLLEVRLAHGRVELRRDAVGGRVVRRRALQGQEGRGDHLTDRSRSATRAAAILSRLSLFSFTQGGFQDQADQLRKRKSKATGHPPAGRKRLGHSKPGKNFRESMATPCYTPFSACNVFYCHFSVGSHTVGSHCTPHLADGVGGDDSTSRA
jgi:hypothetical protein